MSQDMLYYMYVPRRDLEEVPWAKLFEIKKKLLFSSQFSNKISFQRYSDRCVYITVISTPISYINIDNVRFASVLKKEIFLYIVS